VDILKTNWKDFMNWWRFVVIWIVFLTLWFLQPWFICDKIQQREFIFVHAILQIVVTCW